MIGFRVFAVTAAGFSLNNGEIGCLLGPSGCGKSTLLHLLGGLDSPSSGKIWLEDTDLATLGDDELIQRHKDLELAQRDDGLFKWFLQRGVGS